MPPAPKYVPIRYDVSLYPRQGTTSRPENWNWRATASNEAFILESWSEGFMVGALVIMACITIANMRRGVLLHKLILAELLLAMSHGTFCFMSFKGYGWYLSSTATLLYLSWIIHNIVAWLKVRPFFVQPGGFFKPKLSIWAQRIYLSTLALTVPVILFQISDNYRYFNNRGGWYTKVRPYEPLFRDPWWLYTCVIFLIIITRCYGTGVVQLVRRSPRFGILLIAICLAIVFTICDIVASADTFVGTSDTSTDGINPWWKLSLVFKSLTDTILLDDFKTELKRLGVKRIVKEEKRRNSIALVLDRDPLSAYASSTDKSGGIPDYDHSSGSSGSSGERPQGLWQAGHVSGVHDALDMSPTATRSRNDDTNGDVSPRVPNNPDAATGDIDFITALRLGPPGSNSPQHIEYANERKSPERKHINSTKTKISRLPGLHEFKFEVIKPARKSRKGKSDEYHDAVRATSESSSSPGSAKETIDPLSTFGVIKQKGDFLTSAEAQSWTQGTPRNQEQLIQQSELYHQEMAEMRDSVESERKTREKRFRQSIGADNFT